MRKGFQVADRLQIMTRHHRGKAHLLGLLRCAGTGDERGDALTYVLERSAATVDAGDAGLDQQTTLDQLAELEDPRLDLDRVTLIGHSAGGHLALWAAGRPNLPDGAPGAIARPAQDSPPRDGSQRDAPPRVRPRLVISLAGVADLAEAYRRWRGGAVRDLMGGSPAEVPERYAAGDPIRLLALEIPALIVHGALDETVSVKLSRGYAEAARAAGGEVELVEIEGPAGRHRAHLDPRGAAWTAVVERLDDPTAPICENARPWTSTSHPITS